MATPLEEYTSGLREAFGAGGVPGVINAMDFISDRSRNRFGVPQFRNPEYATQTLAALRRAEWQDYQNRFQPVEDILFGFVQPERAQQVGASAQAQFNQGFARSQDAQQRQLQGLGLQMTPEMQRINQQRQALGQVQAYNQAARGTQDLGNVVLGLGTRGRIGGG